MEVELLKKKIKKIRDKQRIKRLALKLIMGAIFSLAGLMIFLSLYSLSITVANKKISQKIEQTKQKIGNLQEIESKQTYLISKLDSFKSLVKQQARNQAIAESVFNLIPDGTILKGFDINESGSLVLAGSVPDWQTLSQLLSRIKATHAQQLPIIKAEVGKISFSAKSGISFDIALTLAGGETK